MLLSTNKDPMGQAMLDYMAGNKDGEILVHCDVADDDVIPVKLLFRKEADMSLLERKALSECRGKILDIGAGSGCHSLQLVGKGLDVHAIDISPGAVEVMRQQGLKQVRQANIFDVDNEQYDTLLLMMNGVGLVATLRGFEKFLKHAKRLLKPDGQILFDTSDIEYLYLEADGSKMVDLANVYYGQVTYQMEYKDIKGPKFGWLYLDYITLTDYCFKHGYDVQVVYDDDRFNYLVRLTLAKPL
ncbi:MAG: class I SAM-dependent methyltransferase [Chitinophagales bacterium]|nr:class I SAM-dependent methyltransferase [Chitinophagales bacterium]